MKHPRRDAQIHSNQGRPGIRLPVALAAFALACTTAGCSSMSGNDASASSGNSPSITDRFGGMFGSKPQDPQYVGVATPRAGATTTAAGEVIAPDDVTCPSVDVRLGASTLTVPTPGENATGLDLKYQGTIGQLARECFVNGGNMRIKVGMQGRIILGPAGGPGVIDVPVRYAVVREGPTPRVVVSDFFRIPVTVPTDQTNIAFTHIDEAISFPMPSASDLENYIVYVGFDPAGAKPAPAKKTPAKRAPKARTSSR